MSRFHDRLADLGFTSYDEYLSSEHWRAFKEKYRASVRPMRCAICQCGPIQLHHHSYDNLGNESVWDVTPLCHDHHKEVHQWLAARKKSVKETFNAVTALSAELKRRAEAVKAKHLRKVKDKPKKGVKMNRHQKTRFKVKFGRAERRKVKRIDLDRLLENAYKTVAEAGLRFGEIRTRIADCIRIKNWKRLERHVAELRRKILGYRPISQVPLKPRTPVGSVTVERAWQSPELAMRMIAKGRRPVR